MGFEATDILKTTSSMRGFRAAEWAALVLAIGLMVAGVGTICSSYQGPIYLDHQDSKNFWYSIGIYRPPDTSTLAGRFHALSPQVKGGIYLLAGAGIAGMVICRRRKSR
jgi:hypothetical protein